RDMAEHTKARDEISASYSGGHSERRSRWNGALDSSTDPCKALWWRNIHGRFSSCSPLELHVLGSRLFYVHPFFNFMQCDFEESQHWSPRLDWRAGLHRLYFNWNG